MPALSTFTKALLVVTLFTGLFISSASAQGKLTRSRTSSYYTYVYKLTNAETNWIYLHPDDRPNDSMFHSLVDSSLTDHYWENTLPPGNYLKVYVEEDRLKYSLVENHSAFLILQEKHTDQRFVLVDSKGSPVSNAAVKLNGHRLSFDNQSACFHFNNSKYSDLIEADFNGVANFFRIKDPTHYDDDEDKPGFFGSIWKAIKKLFHKNENRYYGNYIRDYKGFLVFNKAKYRPNDTIKFKAFILNAKTSKPVGDQKLLVAIDDYGNHDNEEVIGTVNAYRNGGFEYSFVLADSLKLTLDRSYTIVLLDPATTKNNDKTRISTDGHKELISGRFEYEDYDLKSINFSMRLDKKVHSPGTPQTVYLKAVDENDLPVADGRVTLNLEPYDIKHYKTLHQFVADTLWKKQVKLDPVGETKVNIPDSIFPKADISYRVNAEFLNSANESQSSTNDATFNYERYHINTDLVGDTLKASYSDFGRELKGVPAWVVALDDKDDTIAKTKVILPSATIINPQATIYNISTDSLDTDVELSNFEGNVSVAGYHTKDSVMFSIDNPRHLRFWYSVYDNNKLVDAGAANQLDYHRAANSTHAFYIVVNYVWAGKNRSLQTASVYQRNQLNITVKQPVSVYPGQQVHTDIVVTDQEGKPVPNTDVTAWALTRKFQYSLPRMPYLGLSYPRHKVKNRLEPDNDKDFEGSIKLNWQRWSHSMGLDSITYYQFTHTKNFFRIEEPVADTTTQVAPFIMKNGDIEPVHILYIDGKPVYFSQAQQLNNYSFMVKPGIHSLQFRTSHLNLRVDTVNVMPHKKLILGINADAVPTTKVSDTLDNYEAGVLNKYFIELVNNFRQEKTIVEQGDNLYLVLPASGNVLAGPISDNTAILRTGDVARSFIAEPGYSYLFEPGLLKQKSIPGKYSFNPVLSTTKGASDYRLYAVTQTLADSVWQNLQDARINSQQLFVLDAITDKKAGRLEFDRKITVGVHAVLIKAIILYSYDDPDFSRIYPGNTTGFGNLMPGKYRMFFLLKGDNYYIKDDVIVKSNGINYYRFPVKPEHKKDGVSEAISNTITHRFSIYQQGDGEIENDALKIKEAFNQKYTDNSNYTDTMSGTVVDAHGSPVPGATVRVKGVAYGTIANLMGHFTLKVPPRGSLIVSFIGYYPKEVAITPGVDMRITISAAHSSLQEVVVVGYGSVLKKEVTGAVSVVTTEQMLQGKAAGVIIVQGAPGATTQIFLRGNSSFGYTASQPIYVVNGELVESLKGIAPGDIAEVSVLKDAAATAIYGARGANGVVIIVTKSASKTNQANEPAPADTGNTLRKNFSDYAYWQPKLTTDENGKASFTSTFPDDITGWRTFVIGINGNIQSGTKEGLIKAFKPVSANFISPLFAVKGDQIDVIGKVMNYNSTDVSVHRTFSYNGKLMKEGDLTVKNAIIDTLAITAGGADSLAFEYTAKRDNGYFDGEQRKIPLLEQGTEETKGFFSAMSNDTTVSMKFDPTLGKVTFHAEASLLPTLSREAEKLRNYKYLCNEQLASKLIGLLTEKHIASFLNEPFRYEKNIKEIITKIQQNRKPNGLWGWWKDTDEELWISLHAVDALLDAQNDGYKIELDKQKLTDYLVNQLETYHGANKLFCLQLLRKIDAKVDYAKYIAMIEKEKALERKTGYVFNPTPHYENLSLMLLRQQAGLPVRMDSLLRAQKQTMFGNVYWGEENYSFFDNSVQLSLLAYRIIKNDGHHTELLSKIRGYLMEQRHNNEWRNTYETALILENILPDVIVEGKLPKPSTIALKGAIEATVTQFPYSTSFAGGNLNINKTGALPVYITGYQQFWNHAPEKVSKDFTVNSWFSKDKTTLTKLKGGEPVTLQIEVTARADADYVMIEVPIPAGCAYQDKGQTWTNNEVHREYFKDHVSIFCSKLKQGKYNFTISLLPRYSGTYNLNPAKAEMMYFPVFYGREGMKKVVVE